MPPLPIFPYVHAISPYAVKFTEDYGIRWYGLAYLAGFIAGYFLIRRVIQRGFSSMTEAQAGDFVFIVALSAVIGGRLGYCLFYAPELLLKFTPAFPFWKVLAVNEGGMASHGGMIGIVLGCLLFGRKHRIPMLHLMDLTTLGGTAGIFFGRIANFVNGELFGREAPEWLAWGVKFPQEVLLWLYTEPARLLSLAPALKYMGVSPGRWQEMIESAQGDHWVFGQVESTLLRMNDELLQGNILLRSALEPILTLRHPSQIYEALLEGLLLFTVIVWFWQKKRSAGFISGIFFSCYAIARIFCENFRVPDLQIGYQLFGLTRGQWLSFAPFFIGLILLWIAREPVKEDDWERPGR